MKMCLPRWFRYPLAAALLSLVGLVHANAPQGRYVVDAAASPPRVTDAKTGLVWQQSEGGTDTWINAANYCINLGGWRLPTVKELLTIVDYSKSGPAIDPVFPGTSSANYWSGSVSSPTPDTRWVVSFDEGLASLVAPGATAHIRCVLDTP